jgi:peptidoglycan/xylan/chitin deacetylase (PgdA/CDA1 family)
MKADGTEREVRDQPESPERANVATEVQMRRRPWRSAVFLATAGLAVPIAFALTHSGSAQGKPAAASGEGGQVAPRSVWTFESTTPDDTPVRPLDNDCSAGKVEFTFDDGPYIHSRAMLDKLNALHLKATFFVIGENIEDGGPAAAALLRDEIAAGDEVGNHTWDHPSITGDSTKTKPLTPDQVAQELDRTNRELVSIGLPRPTLYRPPYGDIDARADQVAQGLGLRMVAAWGLAGDNVIDSKDWAGVSTSTIVSNVINGYTSDGGHFNGIKDQTIVLMHDGGTDDTLNSIAALQPIVDFMNQHHLCSTSTIRRDATGGRVPAPPPPEPGAANIVHNPSLEQAGTKNGDPACFEHAQADTNGVGAQWSRVADAHTGKVAERITVTRSTGGDRKLLLSRNPSDSQCLPAAKPGTRYGTWVWYKGDWAEEGAAKAEVGIVTYYRQASGEWKYWQTGPSVEPSATWRLTDFETDPVPADATAISFGLAITGTGTITTDDYSMAAQ